MMPQVCRINTSSCVTPPQHRFTFIVPLPYQPPAGVRLPVRKRTSAMATPWGFDLFPTFRTTDLSFARSRRVRAAACNLSCCNDFLRPNCIHLTPPLWHRLRCLESQEMKNPAVQETRDNSTGAHASARHHRISQTAGSKSFDLAVVRFPRRAEQ